MQNNLFLLMLGLVGAALAALALLIYLNQDSTTRPGAPCVLKSGFLNSTTVEHFLLDRVLETDGIFEGELNSITTTCIPSTEGLYVDTIESLGVTVFNLDSQESGSGLIEELTGFYGDPLTLDINGIRVHATENQATLNSSFIWQIELKVYVVLITGDRGIFDQTDETPVEEFMLELRNLGIGLIEKIRGES